MAGELGDAGPGARHPFECDSHCSVGGGLTGPTEVLIERVLDQGVRELVVPGAVGELVDERRRLGFVEHFEEIELGDVRGCGQQLEIEVASDDRGDRERSRGRGTESAEPGADDDPNAVGEAQLLDLEAAEPSTVLVLLDRPGFCEVAEQLADEEGVAVGLGMNRVGEIESGDIEFIAGGRGHERQHAFVRETSQLDLADRRLAMQRGQRVEEWMRRRQLAVAERADDRDAEVLLRCGEVPEELETRGIRPLQIIEYQHDRVIVRRIGDEADNRREEEEALGFGIGRFPRRELRNALCEGRHQADQLGAVQRDVFVEQFLGSVCHVVAECFGEQLIRPGDVFLAVTEDHIGSVVECPTSSLGDECRLAETGLSRHHDDLPLARGARSVHCRGERGEFVVTSDDADARSQCDAPGKGNPDRRSGFISRLPLDAQHVDLVQQAFERSWSEPCRGVPVPPTRHEPYGFGHQDLAPFARGAESCGLDDRVTEIVVVLAAHVAAADPDAQADRMRVSAVLQVDCLLHLDGRRDASRGGTEHGHDAVAEVLDLGAAVVVDHRAECFEVRASDRVRLLGGVHHGQSGRADDVGEEHGDGLGLCHGLPTVRCHRGGAVLGCSGGRSTHHRECGRIGESRAA